MVFELPLGEHSGDVFAFEERRGSVGFDPGKLCGRVLIGMDWVDEGLVRLIRFGDDFLLEVLFKITFHESKL